MRGLLIWLRGDRVVVLGKNPYVFFLRVCIGGGVGGHGLEARGTHGQDGRATGGFRAGEDGREPWGGFRKFGVVQYEVDS